MSRVSSVAALLAVSILASSALATSTAIADAKRLTLNPSGTGSAIESAPRSEAATKTSATASTKTTLAASEKPTVADADTAKSKAELARMRADRALTENGEKAKIEDEEVIGKDDKDPDDTTASAGKGEPVAVKPSNKVTCIAGCN